MNQAIPALLVSQTPSYRGNVSGAEAPQQTGNAGLTLWPHNGAELARVLHLFWFWNRGLDQQPRLTLNSCFSHWCGKDGLTDQRGIRNVLELRCGWRGLGSLPERGG